METLAGNGSGIMHRGGTLIPNVASTLYNHTHCQNFTDNNNSSLQEELRDRQSIDTIEFCLRAKDPH